MAPSNAIMTLDPQEPAAVLHGTSYANHHVPLLEQGIEFGEDGPPMDPPKHQLDQLRATAIAGNEPPRRPLVPVPPPCPSLSRRACSDIPK